MPPVVAPADTAAGEAETVAGAGKTGVGIPRFGQIGKSGRRCVGIASGLRPAEPDLPGAGEHVLPVYADIIVKEEVRTALPVVPDLLAAHRGERRRLEGAIVFEPGNRFPFTAFPFESIPVERLVGQQMGVTAPVSFAAGEAAAHADLIVPVGGEQAAFVLHE